MIPVASHHVRQQRRRPGRGGVDIRLNYFGTLYARVAKENNAAVICSPDDGFILASALRSKHAMWTAMFANRNLWPRWIHRGRRFEEDEGFPGG